MEIPASFPSIGFDRPGGVPLRSVRPPSDVSPSPAFVLTLSSTARTIRQEIRVAGPSDEPGADSRAAAPPKEAAGESDEADLNEVALVNQTRLEIRQQIQDQTLSLIRSFLLDSPELRESLGNFFTENPDALKQVAQGEIPDYFNVENTARRILDIYFNRFDGQDREAFGERARSLIDQAYEEVSALAGGLPGIVQETRAFINRTLDDFIAGQDISDRISADLTRFEEVEADVAEGPA